MKKPRARKSKKPARKPAKRLVRRLPKPSNHFAHDLHASPLGGEPFTGSSPPPERGPAR